MFRKINENMNISRMASLCLDVQLLQQSVEWGKNKNNNSYVYLTIHFLRLDE